MGIKNLAFEIQRMSTNAYLTYPISYCFLLRSILEQSAIYFLINQNKWDTLVKGNNGLDLRLEKIINYITKNSSNLLDDSTKRIWNVCFSNSSNKDYFDLVIHHPYKIIANPNAIQQICETGLFAIVQYFINH